MGLLDWLSNKVHDKKVHIHITFDEENLDVEYVPDSLTDEDIVSLLEESINVIGKKKQKLGYIS